MWEAADTLSKKRVIGASLALGGTWTGSTIGLSQIWYSQFPATPFHFFNDGSDWMQMDKMGHIYTASHLSEANYRLYKWAGISDKKSAWIGAGLGFGFQTTLEILDGKNADWGFSWWDMGANSLGAGLFLSQQLAWKEQRVVMKFSTHPTEFAAIRPNVLGKTYAERLLKDYNGQTYWLSFSPEQFTEIWPIPSWLCFSLGYSVDQKLVGSEDYYVFNQEVFQAKREFLLSLDIDVRELPIRRKWLKTVLRPFHYIKIPFPTLVYSGNKLTGRALYF